MGGVNGWIILNSVLISAFFLFLLPKLNAQDITQASWRSKYFPRITSYFLFAVFGGGLIKFSLSDLFAIMLCTCSVFLLDIVLHKEVLYQICFLSFLLGCSVYAAYNVRTIYLFSGIYILVMLLVRLWHVKWVWYRKIITLLGTFCGLFVAALPQIYMNIKNLGVTTWKVPTNGLMLQQLIWGIQYQRYDTYVGTSPLHPAPQMYFIDPVGEALLQETGITGFAQWGDFFKFVFAHPFEVAGIYVRHLVNVLFPCWPMQYVTELNNNKIPIAFLGYSCFFLFALVCFEKCIRCKKVFYNYIALLIPAIFILPGAVECRFFVSIYLMVLGTLCFNTNWHELRKYILQNKIKTIILYFGNGLLLLSMWSSLLASETVTNIFMY